ncbi:lysine--tRNA ligase [Patescibacteria group bacterium]
MYFDDLQKVRLEKLSHLKEVFGDVFPARAVRSHAIKEVVKDFSKFTKKKSPINIVGRILRIRSHGDSTFFDIEESWSVIQCYIKKDVVKEKMYDLFQDNIDAGDFVEISGKAFLTKKKEKTIKVISWKPLAKSLRPLPEKWHGLQDVEDRFRKRYLDLLMNEEVRNRFLMRTEIISAIRTFLNKEDFKEVETSMLHPVAGGALAKPFVTRHNALDMDLYLRIAPELYLKRLLIGGFERIYEIGKSFRNEGIDAKHNPEFTTVEWYAAYWDEENMMECVERFMRFILKSLKLKNKISFDEKTITFGKKFSRVEFKEILKRHAFILDYNKETRESIALKAKRFGIKTETFESKAKIADEIFKKVCRPHIIQPTFITKLPLEISPLAKKDENNPDEAKRFQMIVGGLELVNAFSELNDPIDQRERFKISQQARKEGESEAHMFDQDFIEALEYGMPPTAGIGIGIDRLVMLLTDTKNIREVILFPTLRLK